MSRLKPVRNVAAPFLTLLVLGGIGWQQGAWPSRQPAAQSRPWLDQLAQAIPLTQQGWVSREVAPLPAAAPPLGRLRVVCREYQHIDSGWRLTLTMVLAQDRLDLASYDPPRWYASQGWKQASAAPARLQSKAGTVLAREYELARGGAGQPMEEAVVIGFIVLPDNKLLSCVGDMSRADQSPANRWRGAAMVQLMFPARVPPHLRRQIAATLTAAPILTIQEGVRSGDQS
ncbi:MAG TPA: hypothetical protein VF184_01465 [Phycisphaeraceae bacterium]